MQLEKQCCTISQAKKLKELGIEQKSIWYWEKMREPIPEGCASERLAMYANVGHPIEMASVEESFSAFNTAELGVMLPEGVFSMLGVGYELSENPKWNCTINEVLYPHSLIKPGNSFLIVSSDMSQAEAMAGMLILIIDDNLITIEDINQRLTA